MANGESYDCIVIGTGPGGYETAIRAAQLGMDTAVVEKDKLGGVCLNVGCIPTKALLRSAEVMADAQHLDDFGLELNGEVTPNFEKVVERSRGASNQMNQGVQYLMNKNDIDVLYGHGTLLGNGEVQVEPSTNMDGEEIGEEQTVEAEHIIIATGARPNEIPPLPIDEGNVVSYRRDTRGGHGPHRARRGPRRLRPAPGILRGGRHRRHDRRGGAGVRGGRRGAFRGD